MISCKNITKIYTSKSKTSTVALDNVSFTLPNKGMVFVCGKSGSGKSTLINLLAGLDDVSSGDIFINGNNITKLKDDEYDDYRNNYVGFVFQDFCLLDTFTVRENIAISLNLTGIEDYSLVDKALCDVGLEEYGKRYPKELSGGQKQRVAIARALVKNPKFILADEPTGNLDTQTTIQVLELLKELSEEKLVVIISHSLDNANEYADRIIELKDGKILSDKEKSGIDVKLFDGNEINLFVHKKLTSNELLEINERVKTGNYKINQIDNYFIPTKEKEINIDVEKLEKSKSPTFTQTLKLASRFTKGNHLNQFFTSLMVSLLLILMVTTQAFTMFNGGSLIDSTISGYTDFALYKGYSYVGINPYVEKNRMVNITEEEINKFYTDGYEGNIYKLYAYNMSINPSAATNHAVASCMQLDYSSMTSLYIESGKGVLECDTNYLLKQFGINNELVLLAGSLDYTGKTELVITDYFADALKEYRGYTTYQEIIDDEKISMSLSGYNVKAIIDTDYDERHSYVISELDAFKHEEELQKKSDIIKALYTSTEFLDFYNDLNVHLSIAYFIDGDFMEHFKIDSSNIRGYWFNNSVIYDSKGKIIREGKTQGRILNESLNPGEIVISTAMFEEMFGVNVGDFPLSALEGFTITISERYMLDTGYDNPYSKKTYKIVGLAPTDQPLISFAPEDYYDGLNVAIYAYGLYFDNTSSIAKTYNPQYKSDFYSGNKFIDGIYEIMNVINIFSDLFKLITISLIIICVIMIVNYGVRNIKRKIYDIGVVKALGAKNKSLYNVFLIQVVHLLSYVSIISITILLFLDDYVNKIIIDNIVLFSKNELISDLIIIKFTPLQIAVNIVSVFVLTLLSSYTLLRTLKRIKPINIIRRRED